MSINFNVALGEGHEANALITSMDLGLAKHEITRYRDEIETVLIESAELNVDSPETESKAVSFGTTAKKLAKRIDDLRKQIIDPAQEYTKAVNNFAKTFTAPLYEIEYGLKKKLSDYRLAQEIQRRKQEEAARRAAAELQARLDKEAAEATRKALEDAKKSGVSPETVTPIIAPQVPLPIMGDAKPITRTDAGSSYQKTEWKFEIIDALAVPREYLAIDERKVREGIRMGVREIPGVRIYESKQTIFKAN